MSLVAANCGGVAVANPDVRTPVRVDDGVMHPFDHGVMHPFDPYVVPTEAPRLTTMRAHLRPNTLAESDGAQTDRSHLIRREHP